MPTLCRADLPSGCETLFAEASTLTIRATAKGYDRMCVMYVEVAAMCNRILELDPSHTRASGLLGQCYQDGNNYWPINYFFRWHIDYDVTTCIPIPCCPGRGARGVLSSSACDPSV